MKPRHCGTCDFHVCLYCNFKREFRAKDEPACPEYENDYWHKVEAPAGQLELEGLNP